MVTAHWPTKAEAKRARIEAARAAAARAQRRSRDLRIGLWSAAGLTVLALVVTTSVILTRPDTPMASKPAPARAQRARPHQQPTVERPGRRLHRGRRRRAAHARRGRRRPAHPRPPRRHRQRQPGPGTRRHRCGRRPKQDQPTAQPRHHRRHPHRIAQQDRHLHPRPVLHRMERVAVRGPHRRAYHRRHPPPEGLHQRHTAPRRPPPTSCSPRTTRSPSCTAPTPNRPTCPAPTPWPSPSSGWNTAAST